MGNLLSLCAARMRRSLSAAVWQLAHCDAKLARIEEERSIAWQRLVTPGTNKAYWLGRSEELDREWRELTERRNGMLGLPIAAGGGS